MPDFTKCVKYRDKLYCRDTSIHQFVIVSTQPVELKDCPVCVVQALIENETPTVEKS